jgi:fatty acid desaturase
MTVLDTRLPSEQLSAFAQALDTVKGEIQARLGAEDIDHLLRVERFSRCMEVVGRLLIHVSLEPVSFLLGVGALWLHKQLQAIEVGHSALHGAYDGLAVPLRFRSERFAWDVPIDEASWRASHNIRHHAYTNIGGRDPDIDFGPVRLTEHTPFRIHHLWQVPLSLLVLFPNFSLLMTGHAAGPPERWRMGRKLVLYYAKNYGLFPLLAGPLFWKVLLGNWMAETLRDLWSAATIYCGHIGPDTKSWPEGTKAASRGAWYAMQVEATNNFQVRWPLSLLCGGLDHQIEHHLFPKLPPNRLREIAPRVRAICEAHGVPYRTETWGRTLYRAFLHLARLSAPRAAGRTDLGEDATTLRHLGAAATPRGRAT